MFVRFGRRIRARGRVFHISSRWLIAASVIVAAGLWALEATVLVEMRRTHSEQARQSASNIVSTISADIARNFELFDLSLQAVADNLKHPTIGTLSKDVRQLMLFDRAATAKHLGRIQVLDENGRVVIDSREIDPPSRDFSNRDYFDIHKKLPYEGLYIGAPFQSASGQQVIGISRRLSHADGSFAGVVVGTMRLSYFRELFGMVQLGQTSALGLMRTDGTLFMRWPFKSFDIGRDLSATEVFKKTNETDRGHFQATAAIDGVERRYVFQTIGNLPLRIVLGTSNHEIYSGWIRQAWYIGTVAVVLGLAMIGLALFAAVELRRRGAAESRLTALAATDGLTGLCNRRMFDAVLEREWTRALQQNKPIALLMLDADHFKQYNDRYGHQMGDKALLAIAECIAACTRTDMDVAARYGGEEFALLLPGASLTEAFEVAERIRTSVVELGVMVMHEHFPTVSVGLSSRIPKEDENSDVLLTGADSALYAAKRGGRNMCQPEQRKPVTKLRAVA